MILYDCIGVICVKKHHFKKKKPIPTEPQWKISSVTADLVFELRLDDFRRSAT